MRWYKMKSIQISSCQFFETFWNKIPSKWEVLNDFGFDIGSNGMKVFQMWYNYWDWNQSFWQVKYSILVNSYSKLYLFGLSCLVSDHLILQAMLVPRLKSVLQANFCMSAIEAMAPSWSSKSCQISHF